MTSGIFEGRDISLGAVRRCLVSHVTLCSNRSKKVQTLIIVKMEVEVRPVRIRTFIMSWTWRRHQGFSWLVVLAQIQICHRGGLCNPIFRVRIPRELLQFKSPRKQNSILWMNDFHFLPVTYYTNLHRAELRSPTCYEKTE